MIEDFKLLYSDLKRKEGGLNVFELRPIGVSWTYEGKKYELTNPNKIIALKLKGGTEIAIVEGFRNEELNRAYILDGNGKMKWNISDLLNQYDHPFFSDVYYVKGDLYFFIYLNKQDYRFSFDSLTGEIGRLVISR